MIIRVMRAAEPQTIGAYVGSPERVSPMGASKKVSMKRLFFAMALFLWGANFDFALMQHDNPWTVFSLVGGAVCVWVLVNSR